MGPPVEVLPPVDRRRRLMLVSQPVAGFGHGDNYEGMRVEFETASGDGVSEGDPEGVVEEPSMFEDPVDVAPRASHSTLQRSEHFSP